MPELPSYDALPITEGAPPGSSWGVWGDGDVFGCLNLLTPERVRRAAGLVRKGAVFALNLELEQPDPVLFNRAPIEHHVIGTADPGQDDEIRRWNTQSSSQWDGFRHIRGAAGFYNGLENEAHGIHHWARRGIAGRAVLADVALWRESEGRPLSQDETDPIDPSDITATLAAQGVAIEEGDVLLLRTGWLSWYRTQPDPTKADLAAGRGKWPGLRPGVSTARFLWDLHIAAIGADNPSVEAWPPGALASDDDRQRAREDPSHRAELFVHLALIPMLGLPLGELWNLDALAADCAEDGVYEFLFTSAPINLLQGVASPPNALAIK